MAKLLSGKAVVAALTETLAARAETLRARGVVPTLAIVRVGESPDDIAYAASAAKRCEACGVATQNVCFPDAVTEEALLLCIDGINGDASVHGCLLLRPLPPHIDEARIRNRLLPKKDVDGITDGSLAGVFTGTGKGYPPCTAQACVEILDYYGIDASGKRAVIVGRSLVVGKPAAMLLLSRNATVTLCHTGTRDLPAVCREADVLLVAAGRAGVVGADCFAPGQTVIDVGIHVDGEGKLFGDVDFAAASTVVDAITPVPGGVGPVTASVLVKHVLDAAEKAAR